MHALAPGDKVLVSGANGFIAIWVVKALLERGYAVRGTVRSLEKGDHLKQLFESYGDKLEIVVVDDITGQGAFDEAIKGVDAIAHTASPFYMNAVDPKEIIDPAVKGTIGMLESALKSGTGLKRIVVTSSAVAVSTLGVDKVFDETDWDQTSVKEITTKGKDAAGVYKYRASKLLAEQAAWDFYKENKGKISWDISVINPPFVFGPPIHDVKDVQSLNTSSRQFYDTVLVEGSKSHEVLTTQGSGWVDVRDLAESHVRALERESAGGERIIICAGSYVWQDWIDVARSLSPSPIPSHPTLVTGSPLTGKEVKHPVRYDTKKGAHILGMSKYRTREEMVRDTLADFERRGW